MLPASWPVVREERSPVPDADAARRGGALAYCVTVWRW